jgi:ABC-type methionine transport system ATPase subunit
MNNLHDRRPKEIRIALRIPRSFHQEPIISQLASRHNLEVNIVAAILGKSAEGDGWFDIQLRGNSKQIDSALIYLSDLNIEIWNTSNTEEIDGW